MRIGIDLGGTKIEALALGDGDEEVLRQRVPTPKDDYAAIIDAVARLVQNVESKCGAADSVGMGIPGSISPATGLVKNANSQALIGHPLDKDLSQRLQRPIRISNDANCFALSESQDGAARASTHKNARTHVVFGVIIGTGTGGGLVVDNKIVDGPDGVTGEWGHIPLPWPDETMDEWPLIKCWCGMNGCLENYLSGPGMQNDHKRRTGLTANAQDIVAHAAGGDGAAQETLKRFESRLARGLATMINVLNPDVIVLGGGLSNIDRIYENVPRLWQDFVFSDVTTTLLVRAQHGDSSGVRGAARLWPRKS